MEFFIKKLKCKFLILSFLLLIFMITLRSLFVINYAFKNNLNYTEIEKISMNISKTICNALHQ